MLEQCFFLSFCVWAIHAVFWGGMILGGVGDFARNRLPMWLQKPFCECPICMTPYWGSAIYILSYGFEWKILMVLLGAMGINAIIVKFLPENWNLD